MGHGEYTEIKEEEFLPTVYIWREWLLKNSSQVVSNGSFFQLLEVLVVQSLSSFYIGMKLPLQVTKSYRTVVHIYHKSFESCKVMDMHLKKMAKKFYGTKFVYLEAEKAPFFVQKLAVQTIPSVCLFIDGVLVHKQLGFQGIEGGERNDIRTAHLARGMRMFDVLEEEFDSEEEW